MSISQNFPILAPTLTHDFVKTKRMDPRITFTRSSSATYFNSSGVLTTAANNEPRFDHDPATLSSRGFLPEEQRTNSIRNNTMQGAVAGTPGTDPTNWVVSGAGGAITSKTIVGFGTDGGIAYVDIRFVFNAGGTATIRPEQTTQIAASSGQTWTGSSYVKLAGGSLANCTVNKIVQYRAAGVGVTNQIVAFVPTTAELRIQRETISFAATDPTTTTVNFDIQVVTSGAADITLRIGLPQLEQGAFATSVIPTTTTTLTRNADVASMTGTNFSSWFNPTQGTIFNISRQAQNRTTGYPTVVCISDSGSGINAIEQYWDNSSNFFASLVYTSSTLQTSIGRSGLTRTDVHENAFAYEANNFACSVDGSAVSTDNSGSIPTIDRLCIGSRFDGSLNFNGYIQRISYYPVRLTNAQLQALTL
jgi:hypothetical protein